MLRAGSGGSEELGVIGTAVLRATTRAERRTCMHEQREEFVEPEIIKHEEKLADVTLQVGYTDDVNPAAN